LEERKERRRRGRGGRDLRSFSLLNKKKIAQKAKGEMDRKIRRRAKETTERERERREGKMSRGDRGVIPFSSLSCLSAVV
jgi:hypothetical protein